MIWMNLMVYMCQCTDWVVKGGSGIIVMCFKGFTGHQNPTLPEITNHLHSILQLIHRKLLHLGPLGVGPNQVLNRRGPPNAHLQALLLHLLELPRVFGAVVELHSIIFLHQAACSGPD